jgi:transposase-like protein
MTDPIQMQEGAPVPGALIKTDSGGRVRYSNEFRREVLAGYSTSSMSAAAFARHCGVRYSTLAAWVRKDRPPAPPPAEAGTCPGPRFLVATLGAGDEPVGGRPAPLELEVAPGMVARVRDAAGVALLAELARQLSAPAGRPPC